MSYVQKYLKYKKKYLPIQVGGQISIVDPDTINWFLPDDPREPCLNPIYGYYMFASKCIFNVYWSYNILQKDGKSVKQLKTDKTTLTCKLITTLLYHDPTTYQIKITQKMTVDPLTVDPMIKKIGEYISLLYILNILRVAPRTY